MVQQQIVPTNIYYHINKREWRARYLELEAKKAKHFSCKRYGSNKAYFMATLVLRVLTDKRVVLSNDDITFWYTVIKDFRSLDEVPRRVMLRPPTRKTNKIMTNETIRKKYPDLDLKMKFLDYNNQKLFYKVVSDLEFKTFVINPTFKVPDLCITSIKNEASNLCKFLKKFTFEGEEEESTESESEESIVEVSSDTQSVIEEEPSILIYEIIETLLNEQIEDIKSGKYKLDDLTSEEGSDFEDSEDKEEEEEEEEEEEKEKEQESKSKKITKSFKNKKEDKENINRKPDPGVEDILSLINMNERTYGEISSLLNTFILKSSDTLNSYDFLIGDSLPDLLDIDINNLESKDVTNENDNSVKRKLVDLGNDDFDNYIKICSKNEEIIKEMSKNWGNEVEVEGGLDNEDKFYYKPRRNTFIGSFDLSKEVIELGTDNDLDNDLENDGNHVDVTYDNNDDNESDINDKDDEILNEEKELDQEVEEVLSEEHEDTEIEEVKEEEDEDEEELKQSSKRKRKHKHKHRRKRDKRGEDPEIEKLINLNKFENLYDQQLTYSRPNEDIVNDKNDKQNEPVKISNDKLLSLIKQTQHIKSDKELCKVIYECLESESKCSSDLGSLIQVCGGLSKDPGILFKSNRLYHLDGIFNDQFTDVTYKNGKILPTTTLQFYARSTNKIRLRSGDRFDVNMDSFDRIFNRNYTQDYTVRTILDNLDLIDEKLLSVVDEYESMHKSLFKYTNNRNKLSNSTNEIEELTNLETLHFVAETLMETKLRLIQQVHTYYNSQIELLDSIMPKNYYKAFSRILFHKPDEF